MSPKSNEQQSLRSMYVVCRHCRLTYDHDSAFCNACESGTSMEALQTRKQSRTALVLFVLSAITFVSASVVYLPYLYRRFWPNVDIGASIIAGQVMYEDSLGMSMAGSLFALPLFFLYGLLRSRARLNMQRAANELLMVDPRPPVVYLRPFEIDGRFDTHPFAAALSTVYLGLPFSGSNFKTFEEILVEDLEAFGPVLAVQDPRKNDDEKVAGAARILLSEEWFAGVCRLVQTASLAVVVLGRSTGISMELAHVLKSNFDIPLVILLPHHRFRWSRWWWLRKAYPDLRAELRQLPSVNKGCIGFIRIPGSTRLTAIYSSSSVPSAKCRVATVVSSLVQHGLRHPVAVDPASTPLWSALAWPDVTPRVLI